MLTDSWGHSRRRTIFKLYNSDMTSTQYAASPRHAHDSIGPCYLWLSGEKVYRRGKSFNLKHSDIRAAPEKELNELRERRHTEGLLYEEGD